MPLWIPTPLLPFCNLSDLPSPPTAAHNLGLGTADNPTFAGLTVNGPVQATHFIGTGTPTVAAGPGAGTNGDLAISIAGTDASMQVSLTFGSGAGVGALFTVTFATAFASAPFPVFSAASAATGLDIGSGSSHELYISATTTTVPDGDRGGNESQVRIAEGKPVQLHKTFDDLLGRDNTPSAVGAAVLEADQAEHDDQEAIDRELKLHTTPAEWTKEGFAQ